MRAPGTGAAARILLALAGAVMFGLAASAVPAAASSSSPAPSGTATVRGVLLHGDPATPVAGSKVTLHGVADGADPLTLSATTDAKGRFVFGGLAGGDRWSYTATAQSDGTQFSTDALAVKAGETLTTTLSTYEVTTDPSAITRSEWLVWLDVEGSTLAVQQDVSERNTGRTAYTGSTPVAGAPDGGKAAVTLPVVTGATSLSYLGSFEVCCDAVTGTTWVHTRPVPPGTSTGTLRYEAPTTDTLTFPVTTTTQTFTLLVPTGTSVTSPQLAPSGTQSDRGITYQVLKGGPFPTGTTITVSLVGAGGGGSSTALVIGLVVVGLALVTLVVWLLRRRGAAQAAAAAPARPGAKPATAGKARQGGPEGDGEGAGQGPGEGLHHARAREAHDPRREAPRPGDRDVGCLRRCCGRGPRRRPGRARRRARHARPGPRERLAARRGVLPARARRPRGAPHGRGRGRPRGPLARAAAAIARPDQPRAAGTIEGSP
ncbi:MAG: carboxypeptidase-like regulatory domain-containing protein [Candidatus Nanopelagicales bacterium]